MSEVKRYFACGGMIPVEVGFGEGIYVSDADFRSTKIELNTITTELKVTAERMYVLEQLLNLTQGHIGDASLSRDIDEALNSR